MNEVITAIFDHGSAGRRFPMGVDSVLMAGFHQLGASTSLYATMRDRLTIPHDEGDYVQVPKALLTLYQVINNTTEARRALGDMAALFGGYADDSAAEVWKSIDGILRTLDHLGERLAPLSPRVSLSTASATFIKEAMWLASNSGRNVTSLASLSH